MTDVDVAETERILAERDEIKQLLEPFGWKLYGWDLGVSIVVDGGVVQFSQLAWECLKRIMKERSEAIQDAANWQARCASYQDEVAQFTADWCPVDTSPEPGQQDISAYGDGCVQVYLDKTDRVMGSRFGIARVVESRIRFINGYFAFDKPKATHWREEVEPPE